MVSYRDLLGVFWYSHNSNARAQSDQYKSVIFYHDEEQKQLAEETRDYIEETTGRNVYTEIVPATVFYLAEDYHQKYYLQQLPEMVRELRVIYPDFTDFTNSTLVARLNGYMGGYGNEADLEAELGLEELAISEENKEIIREKAARGLSPACPVLPVP